MIGLQELVLKENIKIITLADQIKIHPSCIYGWFKNNKIPENHLNKLSEIFNISKEYLNTKVNDINPYAFIGKGFNNYEIKDDYTIIFITKKSGETFETLIDTEDLQKLIKLNWNWRISYKKNSQSWYVETRGKGTNKTQYLHKILMGVTSGQFVDHKNNNTLDNRKDNLRVTENKYNTRNRKSKNSNNKSGYRNVSWNGSGWSVQLQIEGKNTTLKRFKKNQLDEAGVYAEEMRQKYYGEFAGKS